MRLILGACMLEWTIASLPAAAPSCMESKSARPFDAWSRDRPQRLELDAAASSAPGGDQRSLLPPDSATMCLFAFFSGPTIR